MSIQSMVHVAIENARFHGINLHRGVENLADGDCIIEAIKDNISTRHSFHEYFEETAAFYRKQWLNEAEDLVLRYSGIPEKKFRTEWNVLKQPKTYEFELGDYVLAAIAHCVKKDILIFNTTTTGPFDPILVIEAAKLGNRKADTEIPVLLAYNQVHFEGLVPNSKFDEEKTVSLKKLYLSGEYKFQKTDIPIFSNLPQCYADAVKAILPVSEKKECLFSCKG